ncbi:minor capsid protein [Lactobacillus selangorensis]|uniref:Minor capsid protein n=1 Tax=Lactobacillus selangorensis TaxID=81857 RepID=A0A0R2G1Z5_9LACO|nr:glycerophosphodiester phosphodiesterase family protein [Lactobacillus selangorensis]KRN29240.1 minor capsid protein [Lactobacillus selangorensis]KRN31402.1 minor capsid protein [Lactobacillus selangorensis]
MELLTFNVDLDRRNLVDDQQKFDIDFSDSQYSWVQARQYENQMRQVQVNVVHGDGSPFDLTGCNPVLEGLMPDGVHRIIDAKHGVILDAQSGQFRFDFPASAFALAGSYKQIFFRLYRDGLNVATLEFSMEVMADKVISGLIPADYITPFEDLFDKLEEIYKNADSTVQGYITQWKQQIADVITNLNGNYATVQNTFDSLKIQLEGIQDQIKSGNIITVSQFNDLKDGLAATINAAINPIAGTVGLTRSTSWFYRGEKTLCAHRGSYVDAAENTVMAADHAGRYGYGMIECDPRVTSDSQIVIMHDDTVDRMTDGTGNVADFTLAQLKSMKVDVDYAGKKSYNTIRIPTLDELLETCKKWGMGVNLDGNKVNWQDEDIIRLMVNAVKKQKMLGQTLFSVSDDKARTKINALYPEVTLSWAAWGSMDAYIAEASSYTNAMITMSYAQMTANGGQDFAKAQASGIPLYIWSVNTTDAYADCIAKGVRMIETDNTLMPMQVGQA